jgi:hypothetical protein
MKTLLRKFWFPILWRYYINIVKSTSGGFVYTLLIHLELNPKVKLTIRQKYLAGKNLKVLIMTEIDTIAEVFKKQMTRKIHKISKRRVMINSFNTAEADIYFNRVEAWQERMEFKYMMDKADKQFKETI